MRIRRTTRMVWLLLIALSVCVFGIAYVWQRAPHLPRWAVYYTQGLPPEAFNAYEVLVFDRDSHPPLAPLKADGKQLYGYISLGEAETYRKDLYAYVKAQNWLLDLDKEWTGNPVIDTRNTGWHDYMLNTLIPSVTAQGFDGIILDTADSIVQLEQSNPVRYKGLMQGAVSLIVKIRMRYPGLHIMLNRGFELLPQVAPHIDVILAESVYANGRSNPPALFPADTYMHFVRLLHDARKQAPNLSVYSLDYWSPDDKEGIKQIYAAQRAQGFAPYVSTMDLQHLLPEPH